MLSSLHLWNALAWLQEGSTFPEECGMQGVLWRLPDELPEDLRPSPKLVSPSVPEDEEYLP